MSQTHPTPREAVEKMSSEDLIDNTLASYARAVLSNDEKYDAPYKALRKELERRITALFSAGESDQIQNIAIGSVLIANDQCIMKDTGKAALTIGNEYTVNAIKGKEVRVSSDLFASHWFKRKNLHKYFRVGSTSLRTAGVKNEPTGPYPRNSMYFLQHKCGISESLAMAICEHFERATPPVTVTDGLNNTTPKNND